MQYNFDKIIDRTGSGDLKHGVLLKRYGDANLLPLWVADMDFETPYFITDALRKRLEHSLFGYTVEPEELWPSVTKWIHYHHQWKVEREWLTYIPGIVKGIGMAINVFSQPGDTIIIQPPVYHPFRLTPEGNSRNVAYNPLLPREDGLYDMDFEGLENIISNLPSTSSTYHAILILCNPHNPAGICWSRDTLIHLAKICHKNNILVISDEIHCDMALFGNKHIPFASVSNDAAEISITFQAPSKTFNIAGIVSSYAIVPNPYIRQRFYSWLTANELNEPDVFAPIATVAAYTQGEQWRQQMLDYVEKNVLFVEDYINTHINTDGNLYIKAIRPQASFLVWLDCRGLGLNHEQLTDFFIKKAHLALNDGEMFGIGTTPNRGAGFMRLNVATPRCILEEALTRISHSLHTTH